MQVPVVADRQQQVWPLQNHPLQAQLGQVQVLLPDAYVASMKLHPADPVKLGFMCGSLPVPTCSPSDVTTDSPHTMAAALIPATGLQTKRVAAPRYRVLPNETDLNMLPSNSFQTDPILPVSASHEAAGSCKAWAGSYLSQPLARKCEALAVNALADYGDDIDVVAPVDLLKQLFKTPYCKARLSLAVHRIGRTLILNSGPDEWRDDRPGGKLGSQKKSHAQAMERTLFSKFVQHSTKGNSCDFASSPDSDSQAYSTKFGFQGVDDDLAQHSTSRVSAHHKGKHRVSLGHYSPTRCGGGFETVQKKRFGGAQQRETEFVQKERPAEGQQRPAPDGYLRVLFWQFQNLRMLLGSDLLLFSNENHAAVSLHLLEIERQVTPLMWLDAWLDNVMASIPELAVCYHHNGVVQGYELLKTDDIFLVKGLAEDGTAFFHPHVVQKNASSVLRFLQDNCKQDPGTYWLLKNAGEDLMQLFDLSVISKTCSSHPKKDEKSGGTLPSTRNSFNEQYSLPLAMLLYRLTRRLCQSQDPGDQHKCAKLFGKCLEFMEEQEHLIIRASAHEHVARLILTSFKEIGSMLQPLLLESNITEGTVGAETKQAVLVLPCPVEQPVGDGVTLSSNDMIQVGQGKEIGSNCLPVASSLSKIGEVLELEALMAESQLEDITSATALDSSTGGLSADCYLTSTSSQLEAYTHLEVEGVPNSSAEPHNEIGFLSAADSSPKSLYMLTDPVSARLAAVHHISQAIKSLRWQRQLDVGDHPLNLQSTLPKQPGHSQQFPLCICGDEGCVAVCNFREIGVGAQMDQTLWRLILLLGEAYLALGQAYKDDGQFSRAFRAAELACLICSSMPEVNCNTVSSRAEKLDPGPWSSSNVLLKKVVELSGEGLLSPSQSKLFHVKDGDLVGTSSPAVLESKQQGPFWGKLWMFVGDVFVEIQRSLGIRDVMSNEQGSHFEELTMAQEVMKEVKRLKKKIGQLRSSCEMCSLTRCSCQSDRASSGDSASSCSSSGINMKYGRKHNKKANTAHDKVDADGSIKSKGTVSDGGRKGAVDYYSSRNHTNNVKKAPEAHCQLNAAVTTLKSSTSQSSNGQVSDGGCNKPDIFSYLRMPVTVDWEANLSAAVHCYSNAILAFNRIIECSQDLELTLRKKGWACNELGRMRLAHGQIKLAESAFTRAIEAFRGVKDPVNIVLVHCNLGHGERAAAETLAEKLSAWEECDFLALFVQTIAEAKFLYGEALKFYGLARLELLGVEDEMKQSIGGLWVEVHTQLAHTYLRLGMLLAREENFVYACRRNNGGRKQLGNEECKDRSDIKDATPTKDAITKALEIYKSLGSLRIQEAAFAQYQLACHHRDSCKIAMVQVDDVVLKTAGASSIQKVKRHASLAELYWQKALDFYHPDTHSDMFLDILMERSALCLVMATSFHQNQMMEQALNHLLEGRHAFGSVEIKDPVDKDGRWKAEMDHRRPSAKVSRKLIQQLQMLLKNMLAAAMLVEKPSRSSSTANRPGKRNDSNSDSNGSLTRAGDATKLKQMYRIALQEEPNLGLLFNLWMQ